ncbi:MAG: hypothetical protein HON23_07330 [Rickettsiales bacterium]|nr:hypothetical protein [Rickettsiales bacterium]
MSGATTANLAGIFNKKVTEYKNQNWFYSFCFVVYYGMASPDAITINTFEKLLLYQLLKLPLMAFAIWVTMFFGNRRAESKKLEEPYKHKEVLARAFMEYRESIKQLDEDDSKLLKIHMNNLLNVMNIDSGNFLDIKRDKHPIIDFFSKK